MRKLIKTTLQLAAVGVLATQTSWAVPKLQLDIVGGSYDTTTQTTVSSGPIFTLEALAQSSYVAEEVAAGSPKFYISAAITPNNNGNQSGFPAFGSFSINGVSYNAGNLLFGRPPVENGTYEDPNGNPNNDNLPPHGIFPTYFAEIEFEFDQSATVPSYNTADPGDAGQGTLARQTFAIDASGLLPGYEVHFDLYDTTFKTITSNGNPRTRVTLGTDESLGNFAPFSHDAESGGGRDVPDAGSTMALLGVAVSALGGMRRFLRS